MISLSCAAPVATRDKCARARRGAAFAVWQCAIRRRLATRRLGGAFC